MKRARLEQSGVKSTAGYTTMPVLMLLFCHLCMMTEVEKKFKASTKRELTFISKGYTNWKDACEAFQKHFNSDCHKEAVESIELPLKTGDLGEMLCTEHKKEKEANRAMLRKIIESIHYLARQGLALRGHKDEADSNFSQLLLLRGIDCPALLTWLKKKTNKYTSGEIQNEFLEIMALHILRQICSDIAKNGFFTIMADECTDVSNKEQFVICIRWVDNTLTSHEDVIGLYNVETIDACTLFSTIEDVLLRMNLTVLPCRGQCYDGASNMVGRRKGVATQLARKEKRAVLTHCYGHALNLAVEDSMKQSKVCKDALDTAFKISKLIRYSPKRNAAFDRIKVENLTEEHVGSGIGIRAMCPTRWTVRGDAVESSIENYVVLKQLWSECLTTQLDPDVKGRIIGVQAQMATFYVLFGLQLAMKILKITDNLSRTLQKQTMSAAEGHSLAECTVKTLVSMRTTDCFDGFLLLVHCYCEQTNTNPPVLPRKRRAPQRFEVGTGEGSHSSTVEDHYRHAYFEVLDLAIASISDRFNQPGYAIYQNLESLIVSAANCEPFDQHLKEVVEFYENDLNSSLLSAQLQNLGSWFTGKGERLLLKDCIQAMQEMSTAQKELMLLQRSLFEVTNTALASLVILCILKCFFI